MKARLILAVLLGSLFGYGCATKPCDINEGFVFHSRGPRSEGFLVTDSKSSSNFVGGEPFISEERMRALQLALNFNCRVRRVIEEEIAKEQAKEKPAVNPVQAITDDPFNFEDSSTCKHDGEIMWPAGVPFCAKCGLSWKGVSDQAEKKLKGIQ